MERVKGEKYWSIVQTMHGFEVCDFIDDFDEWDNADFEIGNRFPVRESAEAMAEIFRAVLKGAEVIEMPSEEELYQWVLDASYYFDQACDNGCGELLSKGQRENIIETLNDIIREFLQSKIVK